MVYGDFDNPNTSSPIFHNPFYTLSFNSETEEQVRLRDCKTKRRKEQNKYSTKLCLDIIIIFQIKVCT